MGHTRYDFILTYFVIEAGEADGMLAVDQIFGRIFRGVLVIALGAGSLLIHGITAICDN